MAIFSIESTKKLHKIREPVSQLDSYLSVTDQWKIKFDSTVATEKKIGRWNFLWYGEFNTLPDLERVVSLLESGYIHELWGFRGILLAICKIEGCIYLFNDCYGAFPVYLNNTDTTEEGEPLASDSLRSFSGRNVDWASFYQFLSFGYVFAPYSLFEGIARLSANTGIKMTFHGKQPEFSSIALTNFWNLSDEGNQPNIDELIDIFREEAKGFESTQLMMSGGWDSRLLLAVLSEKKPRLYTHGDLNSREIAIVKDIASLSGLPLIEKSFSKAHLAKTAFESYLHDTESAMFTHWNQAGAYADQNQLIMTAGTFGEVLGGHYGALNTLPGKKKYASLLMHLIGAGSFMDNALQLNDQDTVLNYLKMSNYGVFWFVNTQLMLKLRAKNLVEQSNERLIELFRTYEDQGMKDAQPMFERFYTEHRGGQYINRQLSNSARTNNFRNIFTNEDLVRACSSLSFSKRAHNKINRKIIEKLYPELLDFPMAATLVNARRPILAQEGSRAFRKLLESNSVIDHFYRIFSRYGDRSFGWNDFRQIVDQEWIGDLKPLLSENLWDQQKLIDAVRSNNTSNMYQFFDMISKAITLDYLIKGSSNFLPE